MCVIVKRNALLTVICWTVYDVEASDDRGDHGDHAEPGEGMTVDVAGVDSGGASGMGGEGLRAVEGGEGDGRLSPGSGDGKWMHQYGM